MTCKDCVHYEVCEDVFLKRRIEVGELQLCDCENFISKSSFVEVVRCKNCDVPHNKWIGCPNLNGLIPHPDFYCAKGTPKERGGEKALKERESE